MVFLIHNIQLSDGSGNASVIPVELSGSMSGRANQDADDLLFAMNPPGGVLAVQGPTRKQLGMFETEGGMPINAPMQFDEDIASLLFANDDTVIAILKSGDIVKIDVPSDRDGKHSNQTIARLNGAPSSVGLIHADAGQTTLVVGMPDGRITSVASSTDSANSPLLLVSDLGRLPMAAKTISLCTPGADYTAVQLQSDERFDAGRCVAVQMMDYSLDLFGLPIDSAGRVLSTVGNAQLFSPMSLIDRQIGPGFDGSRVVSISGNGRKIATMRSGRLEIRPLVYDPPASEPSNKSLLPPNPA